MAAEGGNPPRTTALVRRRGHRVAYAVVVALLAAAVVDQGVRNPMMNGYEVAMFPNMVYGTAHAPFVHRALLPTVTRLLSAVVPDYVKSVLSDRARASPVLQSILNARNWEPEYLTEYVIGVSLIWLSLLGFVASLRHLLRRSFEAQNWFIDCVPLGALALLPVMFDYYFYPYDFPSLFLFTLGLGLMLQRRWIWFGAIFVLGCLNKETMVLLTLVFVIHYGRRSRMERALFTGLLGFQTFAFLAVKLGLSVVFADNPGSIVEFHLLDHNLPLLRSAGVSAIVPWLVIGLAIMYRRTEKPQFLKDALWILVPMLVLALFLGYIDELRDYYEVYPVVVLLLAQTAAMFLGLPVRRRPGLGTLRTGSCDYPPLSGGRSQWIATAKQLGPPRPHT